MSNTTRKRLFRDLFLATKWDGYKLWPKQSPN